MNVLIIDMYNGNSISSSTEELFVRLDFEEIKNLDLYLLHLQIVVHIETQSKRRFIW